MQIQPHRLRALIDTALEEDIGLGDVTTECTVPVDAWAEARLLAKQDLVVCGLGVVREVFRAVGPSIEVEAHPEYGREGAWAPVGAELGWVRGPAGAILTGERVALNLLQRMSGVASLTRAFVRALDGTGVRVSDTRKTIPGLRMLDKYAVEIGGGANHRWALDGGVLIKDNHLLVAGSVIRAVRQARARAPHTLRVQVECKELHQVREAVAAGADAVLLDNMGLDRLAEALRVVRGQMFVEVSGGIRLDTVRAYALPGVDLISTGQLTHSAPAVDISLDLVCARSSVEGWSLERRDAVQSTNDAARELAGQGRVAPFGVVAERQLAARGRRARVWHAPHGGHLSLSAVVRPRIPISSAPKLSLIAGVAVAKALTRWVDRHRLEVKWPNDILLDGRKVAGVLPELSTRGDEVEYIVVGVGINVGVAPGEWPPELAGLATSLEVAVGAPVDREDVCAAVLEELGQGVHAFEASGGELDARSIEPWLRLGRHVRFEGEAGKLLPGVVEGLRGDGALLVRDEAGTVCAIVAGDVVADTKDIS